MFSFLKGFWALCPGFPSWNVCGCVCACVYMCVHECVCVYVCLYEKYITQGASLLPHPFTVTVMLTLVLSGVVLYTECKNPPGDMGAGVGTKGVVGA